MDEGIYAMDINGVRCWINQDSGTSPAQAYGDIDGQFSLKEGGQLDIYENALILFQQGKRAESVKLLESKFVAVTTNF